jgi:Transposase
MVAVEEHVEVEATWGIYHRMIAAYRHEDRRHGHELMVKLIDSISSGVPRALTEVIPLGRTLKQRAADVLASFDRPGTSNGLTEAINGHLEHLRGSALGFRNLTNYIARSLLETGGFRPRLHRGWDEPANGDPLPRTESRACLLECDSECLATHAVRAALSGPVAGRAPQ